MWDLIVSVPDQCLSFYFEPLNEPRPEKTFFVICEQQRRRSAPLLFAA